MSDGEMSQLSQVCRTLAASMSQPPASPRLHRRWFKQEVQRIQLGRMFARVAVLPQYGLDYVGLYVYGSRRSVNRFRADMLDTSLLLEGAVPFTPRQHGKGRHSVRGAMHGQTHVLVDGRRVNTSRYVTVVLEVPADITLHVGETAGAIGVRSTLELLELDTRHSLHLYAPRVHRVAGKHGGSGVITIGEVTNSESTVSVTGLGHVDITRRAAQQ